MSLKEHWNHVYQSKEPDNMSWYQSQPATSLKLIEACAADKQAGIIDIGGGASVLVDYLLDAGYQRIGLLDISVEALERTRNRLSSRAVDVEWFEADVTEFTPQRQFSIWHDRAVFHFLTEAKDRRKYVETLKRALTPDGCIIIATFAIDGPEKCSGLPVVRYNAQGISAELGTEFRLLEQTNETHVTPWGTEQKFSYFRFNAKTNNVKNSRFMYP